MQEPIEYEFYHHGIKGQKHGVRRWQNEDGSLTPAGKIRYRVGSGLKKAGDATKEGLRKAGEKLKDQHDKRKAIKREEKLRKIPARKLTTEELQTRIERLKLEKSYKDLLKEVDAPTVSKGKAFVGGILESSVKNIASQATTYVIGAAVNKMFMKTFGEKIVNPKKGQKDK